MCISPLRAVEVGRNENGKKLMKFIPRTDKNYNVMPYTYEIPCGHCIECRLAYARDWANRMMLEYQYHEDAIFLTLTYNNENLPLNEYNIPTLVKKHGQLFIKRLRKYISDHEEPEKKIRFFLCGEYGSVNNRPHYHVIIFGWKPEDLYIVGKSSLNDFYYSSEIISNLWKYGFNTIGEVTWDSCCYVARYVLKKQYGKTASMYDELKMQPEYCTMSLNPAIGRQYYEYHKHEIFDNRYIYLELDSGGRKVTIPKYYKRLYEAEYPEKYLEFTKDNNDKNIDRTLLMLENTSRSYLDVLEDRERNLSEKSKILQQKASF